jgi:hypothetical protein
MPFFGPYPTKFSGHTNTMVISATAFSGGVTNAGTIGPGGGVIITSSTFITGGFLNTNLISGTANGIGVLSDSTIHGAVVDSGTINLTSVGTFSGSIVNNNTGKIFAGAGGIDVSTVTVFGAGSVAGGITNAGTISGNTSIGHAGIFVSSAGTFLGKIINASGGKIVAAGAHNRSAGAFQRHRAWHRHRGAKHHVVWRWHHQQRHDFCATLRYQRFPCFDLYRRH